MVEQGYVYVLQSPTGFWKIGKTSNPADRLKTFSVKLPFEVKYAHLIECYNMTKLEAELHQIFQSARAEGEWFMLTSEEINWIKQFFSQVELEGHLIQINANSIVTARSEIANKATPEVLSVDSLLALSQLAMAFMTMICFIAHHALIGQEDLAAVLSGCLGLLGLALCFSVDALGRYRNKQLMRLQPNDQS